MGDDFVLDLIVVFVMIMAIAFLGIIVTESINLRQENKILELNNSNLKTEINHLTNLKDLFIDDNSKSLIEIYNLTNQINTLESERKRLISELGIEYKTQSKLKEIIKQNQVKAGLINPTYKQLKDFVWIDRVDENEWTDAYDCTEYSNEFISNFAKEGFYSCIVEIDYTKREGGERFGHIIVAINTTDKGLIYLEPQKDKLINPVFMKIGYNYCSAADWDCNWKMGKISSCFDLI